MDQADYVLGRFDEQQWAMVQPALDKAADAAEVFVASGLDAAMNQFNALPMPPKPPRPVTRPEEPGAVNTPIEPSER
jgi:hypothetical protein